MVNWCNNRLSESECVWSTHTAPGSRTSRGQQQHRPVVLLLRWWFWPCVTALHANSVLQRHKWPIPLSVTLGELSSFLQVLVHPHKLLLICSSHNRPCNIILTIVLFSQNGFVDCPLERVPTHHNEEHWLQPFDWKSNDSRLRQSLSIAGGFLSWSSYDLYDISLYELLYRARSVSVSMNAQIRILKCILGFI